MANGRIAIIRHWCARRLAATARADNAVASVHRSRRCRLTSRRRIRRIRPTTHCALASSLCLASCACPRPDALPQPEHAQELQQREEAESPRTAHQQSAGGDL